MEQFDILIVGGGAAGIAAAKAAHRAGCRSILMVDRREALGGILRQCAHHGFGQGLTGPEYLEALTQDFPQGITLWLSATVLSVARERTARILSPGVGDETVSFRQLILAAGCRERPIGALSIPGTRPRGIYTAGDMQERMNLHGFLPKDPMVILGSGDLGLILANQLSDAGMAVTLVEQRAQCSGMARNQACVREGRVTLLCGATITEVLGERELEGVMVSNYGYLPCKTLLTAVGLVPDRALVSGLGEPEWLRLCGNCRTVHPMVEAVIHEGSRAGIAAWERIRGGI